jgi:hypothetical protein
MAMDMIGDSGRCWGRVGGFQFSVTYGALVWRVLTSICLSTLVGLQESRRRNQSHLSERRTSHLARHGHEAAAALLSVPRARADKTGALSLTYSHLRNRQLFFFIPGLLKRFYL